MTEFTKWNQETLHEFSFNIGYKWATLEVGIRERIMDMIDGSSGLGDWAIEEAGKFDTIFEAKLAVDAGYMDYYREDLDNYFEEQFGKLIARVVADRMTEGAPTIAATSWSSLLPTPTLK